MTEIFGIKSSHWDKIKGIFSAYPEIESAILFGSRAMGTHKAGSDIDIAVVGKKSLQDILNKIRLQYDDLYLPWKLDLVSYNEISNADLKEHIDRVGKVL